MREGRFRRHKVYRDLSLHTPMKTVSSGSSVKSIFLLKLVRHFKKSGVGFKWDNNNAIHTTGIGFPPFHFSTYKNDNYVRVQDFPVRVNLWNFCVDYDPCKLMAKMIKHGMILPKHIPESLL